MKRIFKEKLNFLNRGVYSTRKLERMLRESVDYDRVKDKEIYVAATYIGDDKSTFIDLLRANYKHYFKKDQHVKYVDLRSVDEETMIKTLLASCAIPIAFRPIQIDGDTFYDGGVLDNTPYQPLVDAGCDTILVIDLYTFSPMRMKKVEEVTVHTLYPKKSLRGVLDFRHEHIKRRFDLGYHDMKAMLETILDDFKKEN